MQDRVSQFFDGYAAAFDRIYDEEHRGLKGVLNRALRGSLYRRMDLTVAALRPFAGKKILDIGAGSGRGMLRFAAEGAQEVVALDTAPQMLEIAREHATRAGVEARCRFVIGDFVGVSEDQLKPPFDHAVALGFFDYIADPLPFLRRVAAITKGASVFSFPVRWHLLTPQRKLRYMLRRCPLYFYDERRLLELLKQAGFEQWRIDNLGRDYFVVAMR